ncbi:MAG: hypothetical protein Kow0056_09940 [Coriobacteriia bacterium]
MRLADIDTYATRGDTLLHRIRPGVKIACCALLVAAAVTARDPGLLLALILLEAAAAVAMSVPLRPLLSALLYPAALAFVFALTLTSEVMIWAMVTGRATAAAGALLLLVLTTPYPQVIAPIQKALPPLVSDAFLMTYRTFFLLADKVSRLLTAVRLRSGISPRRPRAALSATGQALGGLLLYSMDLAQRDYDVLRLRGYEARLRVSPQERKAPVAEVAALLVCAAVFASVTALGIGSGPGLGAWWYKPLAGLGALAAAALVRGMRALVRCRTARKTAQEHSVDSREGGAR